MMTDTLTDCTLKGSTMTKVDMVARFSADNKIAADAPTRPLARYPGSKNRLAEWIINHFPGYHDSFILPFGGMAATLMKKTRSGIEVYNDLNKDVCHLFRMIREHKAELIEAIRFSPWSPDSLEEALKPCDDNSVERARRFYCLLWMAHYPFDKWKISFRRQMKYSRGAEGNKTMIPAAKLFMNTEYLWVVAERLRGVTIETMDALELIAQYDYDRALFYCDPPYVTATRTRTHHYDHEMSVEQHQDLAAILNNIQGMAIVSGYASDLYVDLYEKVGWSRVDRIAWSNGTRKVESLWLNEAVQSALEEEQANADKQLSLFSGD